MKYTETLNPKKKIKEMKKQLGFDVARILKTLKYIIIIERNPETGYYVGQCKQVPEAFSQGRTIEELMDNMKEAISLAIECRDEELRERYKDKEVFHRELVLA